MKKIRPLSLVLLLCSCILMPSADANPTLALFPMKLRVSFRTCDKARTACTSAQSLFEDAIVFDIQYRPAMHLDGDRRIYDLPIGGIPVHIQIDLALDADKSYSMTIYNQLGDEISTAKLIEVSDIVSPETLPLISMDGIEFDLPNNRMATVRLTVSKI